MPQLGEHGELLRALGSWLDEQGAGPVQIQDHGTFLAVSWTTGEGDARREAYTEFNLQALRRQALALRGHGARPNLIGGRAELLRTLGQDLDAAQVELSGLVEEDETFVVTGIQRGRYYREVFSVPTLWEESALRRARRSGPDSSASGESRSWWQRLRSR